MRQLALQEPRHRVGLAGQTHGPYSDHARATLLTHRLPHGVLRRRRGRFGHGGAGLEQTPVQGAQACRVGWGEHRPRRGRRRSPVRGRAGDHRGALRQPVIVLGRRRQLLGRDDDRTRATHIYPVVVRRCGAGRLLLLRRCGHPRVPVEITHPGRRPLTGPAPVRRTRGQGHQARMQHMQHVPFVRIEHVIDTARAPTPHRGNAPGEPCGPGHVAIRALWRILRVRIQRISTRQLIHRFLASARERGQCYARPPRSATQLVRLSTPLLVAQEGQLRTARGLFRTNGFGVVLRVGRRGAGAIPSAVRGGIHRQHSDVESLVGKRRSHGRAVWVALASGRGQHQNSRRHTCGSYR